MLNDRAWKIFKKIVAEFQETAHPVSSLKLVERFSIDLSPATVRIEMGQLEDLGFLKKEHVSSGRIPTDQGYRYFVERALAEMKKDLYDFTGSGLVEFDVGFEKENERLPAMIAKFLAKESADLGMFASTSQKKFVFSGVELVLKKPEFSLPETMRDLFTLLEAIEEKMEKLELFPEREPQIFIGKENPLVDSESLSMIIESCIMDGRKICTGIIGPKRMNYQKNISLVDYVTNTIQNKKRGLAKKSAGLS